MTQRMRSWIQTAEIRSPRRMAGLSPRDRATRSYTQRELGVEPLLLRIKPAEVVRTTDEDPSLGRDLVVDTELAGGIIYPL